MLKKQRELAKVFDMGKYNEISGGLDLVVAEKNALQTLKLAQYKKSFKLAKQRGLDLSLLQDIIEKLRNGVTLDEKK